MYLFMKILVPVLLFFFVFPENTSQTPLDDQTGNCIQVLELPSRDSVFLNPVFFCMDSLDNYFYYSSIKTTVCNDSLCQLVSLILYWDLAGYFTNFDTLTGKPLTKYDHLPFTAQDYLKLQMTLSEENSILGEKTRDELLDKNLTRYSEKIDAVTAATAREIRASVVEGALYSTYTLWHLINGEIKEKIRNYTLSNYSDEIAGQLLNSGNPQTLIFGLKNLDESYYFDHFEEILGMMQQGIPLVNFYIAKKMPAELWLDDNKRKSLFRIWDQFDPNTQAVLKRYLDP